MSRLYFMTDGDEMVRRRGKVPKGSVVEAWADLAGGGLYWVGEDSRALLDAMGEPLAPRLSLPEDSVRIFYGPKLCDIESLPREQSLRARVLSVHAIAVAWVTLDRFGARTSYEPKSPADPVFHLRRPGGGAGHAWRRFETKREAVDYMRESYGAESEGMAWAEQLEASDFDDLLKRHARR
jgi:hypothetical protein